MPLHADLLVRLRNASMARIKQVSVPYTQSNLSILSILLQQGFISSMTKGTINNASSPSAFKAATPPAQRLWVTLKYSRNDTPVLSALDLVSRPSKRIWMTREELVRFVSFRRSQFVRPLEMGEVAIVDCGRQGWWEAREAVKRGVEGGEVVARAA